MKQAGWHESKEALNFVEKFVETLTCLPLCSNDVSLVSGYCLALLKKWKSMEFENFDDRLAIFHAIGQLEHKLTEYVSNFLLQPVAYCFFCFQFRLNGVKQNRMLFNEDALKVVSDYFEFQDQWDAPEVTQLGYDENLPLANDLTTPCPSNEYRGSPFVLNSLNKVRNYNYSALLISLFQEHFMEQLRMQLSNEQKLCFSVKNYARNSAEKPMEKLLLEWRWDKGNLNP